MYKLKQRDLKISTLPICVFDTKKLKKKEEGSSPSFALFLCWLCIFLWLTSNVDSI